jgi:hypothetical protein
MIDIQDNIGQRIRRQQYLQYSVGEFSFVVRLFSMCVINFFYLISSQFLFCFVLLFVSTKQCWWACRYLGCSENKKCIVSSICVISLCVSKAWAKVVEIVKTEDKVDVELSAEDVMQQLNLGNLRVIQV